MGTLLIVPPLAINAAKTTASLTYRNGNHVVAFSDSVSDAAVFYLQLPAEYSGSGVDVICTLISATATSGDVDIDVSWSRLGTSVDIDADSFSTPVSTDNTTVSGTSGVPFNVTISCTNGAQMDSTAAGEWFFLKIVRDGASDTASGDIQLIGLTISQA